MESEPVSGRYLPLTVGLLPGRLGLILMVASPWQALHSPAGFHLNFPCSEEHQRHHLGSPGTQGPKYWAPLPMSCIYIRFTPGLGLTS